MRAKVISGFPGVGKTHFYKNSEFRVADSDSSGFSWLDKGVRHPDFPQNYINHIKEIMDRNDIVLVSSHKIVRQALLENNINFTLVFPERELKQEYLQRFKDRGSDKNFVDMLDTNWDSFIIEMEEQEECEKIRLKSGEFLGSAVSKMIWFKIVERLNDAPEITEIDGEDPDPIV